MSDLTYEQLLENMKHGTSNMLILGKPGCGKSYLIRKYSKERKDILLTAPTGIAAMNINGKTVDSLFGLRPYRRTDFIELPNETNMQLLKDAAVLLVDEISMVKFNTLDRVNNVAKAARGNSLPFGGLRLIFIGDLMQLEPVVDKFEASMISGEYPGYIGDPGFYNAGSMAEKNFFRETFDCYFLKHNFRQDKDVLFQGVLDEAREGKLSTISERLINGRFEDRDDYYQLYQEGYHFLTVTNNRAASINRQITERMAGDCYMSEPRVEFYTDCDWVISESRINKPLAIKKGMRVMFVVNDIGHDRRWANGTMGVVLGIGQCGGISNTVKVKVEMNGGYRIYDVGRIRNHFMGSVSGIPETVGFVENFPFVPAFATTIDKVQGMTLAKAAIVLERDTRPNQIYVALSRVGSLSDMILLQRKLSPRDVKPSEKVIEFMRGIGSRLVDVRYEPSTSLAPSNSASIVVNGGNPNIRVVVGNQNANVKRTEYTILTNEVIE